MHHKEKRYRFTTSSISFQAPAFILAFILGLLGTKLWEWFSILFNNSSTHNKELNFTQGYKYLIEIEGVWEVFVIGGTILFFAILVTMILITWKARKNEEVKEEERENKLNKLPQEISESIKTTLGIKTTLTDDIVAAYKQLKAHDEEETTNKGHEKDSKA